MTGPCSTKKTPNADVPMPSQASGGGFPTRLEAKGPRRKRLIGTEDGTGETKGLFGINFRAGGCSVSA